METKKWYASKTLWVNVLIVLASILLLATKEFSLSEQTVSWLLFGNGVVNLILRAITGQALTR